MKIYSLADKDRSGVLSVDELFKFILELGFKEEIEYTRIKFKQKQGERITFYDFLSLFDFLNDSIIRFNWNNNTMSFDKEPNENALYHVLKIRRNETNKNTVESENKAIKEEVSTMIEVKK